MIAPLPGETKARRRGKPIEVWDTPPKIRHGYRSPAICMGFTTAVDGTQPWDIVLQTNIQRA